MIEEKGLYRNLENARTNGIGYANLKENYFYNLDYFSILFFLILFSYIRVNHRFQEQLRN